ncbi:hypothetical protein [Nannocystis radixulma]|uniref:EGF-like domain-containing protein n=1 Tax=Nannocystis radixulma TaxID=2995305 RepID=A0ABT5B559_9BACT|nr:hypothetical protein [Nannocystis radixulma]MDC0669241.1 hypothetical protein [Nannocystis radixulma]
MASGACYHGGEVCSNGQSMACEGADGCVGQQACQGDGSFGACLCKAAPDDGSGSTGDEPGSTGSGTTESAGSSDGSGTTGAPPDETGSGGDSSECMPSSCDAMFEEGCGVIHECGQEIVCGCPEGFACEEGKCKVQCDTTYTILNDKMDDIVEHEDCNMGDPVPRDSIMFVVRNVGETYVRYHGEEIEFKISSGEQETIEVGCCMIPEEVCVGLEPNYFRTCEYYESLLVGGSCDPQPVMGCK